MRTVRFTTLLLIAAALVVPILGQTANTDRQAQAALQGAINKEVVDGNIEAAIKQYKDIVTKYPKQRAIVADALVRMAEAYQKLGDEESRKIFQQVVNEFGDQKDAVAKALTHLAVQPQQTARLVESGPGNSLRGAVPSPDGRLLSLRNVEGDIAVLDLTTKSKRLLNNTTGWKAYASEFVFSPDGRQLAYSWYDDGIAKVELRIASIIPGEPVRNTTLIQTNQDEYFGPKAWTPDGKQLVVKHTLPDGTAQIGMFTIQDRKFQSIKSVEWRSLGGVSLSPDGRYIAYDIPANVKDSPRDIFVLATDGSREPAAAVRNPANDVQPLWSLDGKNLMFLSNREGNIGLYTLPMRDGQPIGAPSPLKLNFGPMQLQGLTKNGTLLYYEQTSSKPNLFATTLDGARAVKPASPFTERTLDSNFGSAWSPDGQYLAYYSFHGADQRKIVIRSAKTGDERTVPAPSRAASRYGEGPKWFPDNRSLLVELGDAQGPGFGFYKLSLDTGNTELLTHLQFQITSYDLSSDGRTIFYAADRGDKESLYAGVVLRYDIESRRETEIARLPNYAISLALSRDGSQLAMNHIGGAVDVMPVAGGSTRSLFKPNPRQIGTGEMRQGVAWTPDGRFVLFIQDDGVLYSVPAAGGPVEKVGVSGNTSRAPAVHPDGKQLVFTGSEGPTATGRIWALDNFLPLKP